MGTTYILTSENLMMSILFTIAAAGFLLLVYRACHDALTYNKKFNILLMMLALLSTVLLALIRNNPLLSLGVLGSLSICRIRTNTRDPRDLGFVFWALMIGIASSSWCILDLCRKFPDSGAVLVILHKWDKAPSHQMMVVRGQKPQLEQVQEILHRWEKVWYRAKMYLQIPLNWSMNCRCRKKKEEKLLAYNSNMEGISGVNILAPETKVA